MEQPTRKQLDQLADKWLNGTITPDERELLDQWYNTDSKEPIEWSAAHDSEDSVGERMLNAIQYAKKGNDTSWRRWIAAAASIILITVTASYFYITRTHETAQPIVKTPVQEDIAPGSNKAVLILSDGKQINLSDAKNGQLAQEGNTLINKTADGKVIYESPDGATVGPDAVQYNTLSTPRGGNYDITLSDGTKVWLNAASSIKYPSAFTGNTREVEVTGEAYFEVTHNAAKPFKVRVAGQVIEDLGTSFNINAYSDEPAITATLVEGSIRVSNNGHSATLKPGQQALVRHNQSITLNTKADVDAAMAWHKGLFEFHDADIETVMRSLSRWYDVDVSYEGTIPPRQFSGKIYRNLSALKVSDILSYKKIHFRIEGKRIIVMP